MKRYDLVEYGGYYRDHQMDPADDGEWVRYEDVASIVAGYEQRMALIQWWSHPATPNGTPAFDAVGQPTTDTSAAITRD